MPNFVWGTLALALGGYALVLALGIVLQRRLIFFPSHHDQENGLAPWKIDGGIVGYAREVLEPVNVWLMLHGNAGQAADRAYALARFSPHDSVYIMEYPGYGRRPGHPSKAAFDAAAAQAYRDLRQRYPKNPVCVVGESIGSGPASSLAKQGVLPEKIVLLVPYDKLANVVGDHYPWLPARLILRDQWDNIAALSHYQGPIEIFGGVQDNLIPIKHARALAAALPGAEFHSYPGGHNDWPSEPEVRISNP